MGLEEARSAMNEGLSSPAPAPQTQAPSPSTLSPEVKSQETQGTPSDLTDLGKLEKFKFEGKEWTAEELKKATLRLDDYTRKTQKLAEERKGIETLKNEQKFLDNFEFDLERVLKDPGKFEAEFREIYPERYHKLLDKYLAASGQRSVATDLSVSSQQAPSSPQEMRALVESIIAEKLNPIETDLYQAKTEAAEKHLDGLYESLGRQYSHADQVTVTLMAERFYQENGDISDTDIERLYKQSHDKNLEMIKRHAEEMFRGQTKANSDARDGATGGAIPGSAPVNPRTLREARDHMLSDLERGRG